MIRQIVAPAAVLVAWSLLVLLWLVVARFAGTRAMNIDIFKAPAGGRGAALNGVIADRANWPAHNYTHLMEQPTLFYALVPVLALLGATWFDVYVAWAYVALRVLHSLWQALVNTIPLRFALFVLSTLCLISLAAHALMILYLPPAT